MNPVLIILIIDLSYNGHMKVIVVYGSCHSYVRVLPIYLHVLTEGVSRFQQKLKVCTSHTRYK